MFNSLLVVFALAGGICGGIFLGGFWWVLFGIFSSIALPVIICCILNPSAIFKEDGGIDIYGILGFGMIAGGILFGKLKGGFWQVILGMIIGAAIYGLLGLIARGASKKQSKKHDKNVAEERSELLEYGKNADGEFGGYIEQRRLINMIKKLKKDLDGIDNLPPNDKERYSQMFDGLAIKIDKLARWDITRNVIKHYEELILKVWAKATGTEEKPKLGGIAGFVVHHKVISAIIVIAIIVCFIFLKK